MELFKCTIISYKGETLTRRFTFEESCSGEIQKWISEQEREPRRVTVSLVALDKLLNVFHEHVRCGDAMTKIRPELVRLNEVWRR